MGEGMNESTGYKHDDEILERLFWEFDEKRKGGGERLDFKNALRAYANSFYVAPDTQYQAEAAECAHLVLDDKQIPRFCAKTGEAYSLVGRMELYKTWGEPVTKFEKNTGAITIDGDTQIGKTIVAHRIACMLRSRFRAKVIISKQMKEDTSGLVFSKLADWEKEMVGNTVWTIREKNNGK